MWRADHRAVRKLRVERLVRLRQLKAPQWILRWEQIALARLRFYRSKPLGSGQQKSWHAIECALHERYIMPLLDREEPVEDED